MAPTSLNRILLALLVRIAPLLLAIGSSASAIAAPHATPQRQQTAIAPRPTAPNKVVPVVYLTEPIGNSVPVASVPPPAPTSAWLPQAPVTPIPIAVPQPDSAPAPNRAGDRPAPGNWGNIASISAANIRPVQLWATYYYVHRAETVAGGQPLLNLAGDRLGVTLSRKDWCYAAMQGTVQVVNAQGIPVTYNFAGRGSSEQVDCSSYFSSLSDSVISAVNRSRFAAVAASYGLGTGGYQLVPYRTIAVDRNRIPLGSVVYIPAARGTAITLPSGEQVSHDGYFFAADVGGAIRGNHIDVFIGVAERNPFRFVTSSPNGTFEAYVVTDPEIVEKLKALHKR